MIRHTGAMQHDAERVTRLNLSSAGLNLSWTLWGHNGPSSGQIGKGYFGILTGDIL